MPLRAGMVGDGGRAKEGQYVMAETLKARICSLKMDDGEVLDVHKWVLLKYTDDGSISIEIDYKAMREDGYCIEKLEQSLERRLLASQQSIISAFDQQRLQAMQCQGMRPVTGLGLFGGSLFP